MGKITFLFICNFLLLSSCNFSRDNKAEIICNKSVVLHYLDTIQDYDNSQIYLENCKCYKDSLFFKQSYFSCLILNKKYDKADLVFLDVKNTKPEISIFSFCMGIYYTERGKYNLAKEIFDTLKVDSIFESNYLYYKSCTYLKLKLYKEALVYINEAIAKERFSSNIGLNYSVKANIFFDQQLYDSALKCINISIHYTSEIIEEEYLQKAVILSKLEKHDSAIFYFELVEKVNKNFPRLYITRGIYNIKYKKDTIAACIDFNKALDLGDSSADKYINQFCLFRNYFSDD